MFTIINSISYVAFVEKFTAFAALTQSQQDAHRGCASASAVIKRFTVCCDDVIGQW